MTPRLEALPGEVGIRALRHVRHQPPAPVVGGEDLERLVHEDPAALGGRELAALVVQVVEGLDVVDELPRLAGPEDRRREAERVERHVVLAHELDVADAGSALVLAPPALPAGGAEPGRVSPFGGGADVLDRRVEPDVEDLALHPRPGLAAAPDRDAPVEVAGDAAVLKPLAVVEPLLRDRGREHRPVGLGVEPVPQPVAHQALPQVEVLGLAHLEVGRAGDRRARLDQVGRVELLGAVLALVAAGARIAAVRAGALDVAVGQEAAVGGRVDLLLHHFGDQAGVGEAAGEVLGQRMVLRARRAAEVVERQPEAVGEILLHLPEPRAVGGDRLAGPGGGELGRRAVLVGGADQQHLVAAGAHVAGIDVRRELAAHEVAEVLDPVDVGQRGGDQDAGHSASGAAGVRRDRRSGRPWPERAATGRRPKSP